MTEETKQENKNKGGRPKNCPKCLHPKTECTCGRPPVIDKDVLQKLEDAFMFCFTDLEACLYAGISKSAFYEYQKQNPEFKERKEALRLMPNLTAKRELVGGIKGNINQARWWAQNKMNDEFGEKTTIKHEGGIEIDGEELTQGVDKAIKAFNETMRGVLTKKKDEKPKEK